MSRVFGSLEIVHFFLMEIFLQNIYGKLYDELNTQRIAGGLRGLINEHIAKLRVN